MSLQITVKLHDLTVAIAKLESSTSHLALTPEITTTESKITLNKSTITTKSTQTTSAIHPQSTADTTLTYQDKESPKQNQHNLFLSNGIGTSDAIAGNKTLGT